MKTKNVLLIVIVIALMGLTKTKGQVPTWQWINTAECSSSNAYGEGIKLASDAFGNVYLTGYYTDTITFGTYSLTNPGSPSVFLVKYNSQGDVIWARSSVSLASCGSGAYGIATDMDGNIFITGSYYTSYILFGQYTLTNNGGTNIFIVKYDSSGNVLWANGIGGSGDAGGNGVSTDSFGNSYITGYYDDPTLSFDSYTITNLGGQNIFIAKYDPNGNALWAKTAGGTNSDQGNGITSDAIGTVYVTGNFSSTVAHFDQDSITTRVNCESFFLAKYDPSGNVIWVKSSKGSSHISDVQGYSVAIAPNENIFVTGFFMIDTTIMFGTDTLRFSGNSNIDGTNTFIVKYDSSGNALWAKNAYGIGWCVISDAQGNAYISGGMNHNDVDVVFDTVTVYIPIGSTEPMFIFKFNPAGHALYGFAMEGGGDDNNSLAFGLYGSIYVGGDLQNISPFMWDETTLILTGIEAPFVAKLGINGAGIQDIKPQQTLLLSPNPFTTTTTLTLQGTYHNPSLFIYNLLGQEVGAYSNSQNNQFIIQRNNLPNGMYFYKVMDENKEMIGIGKMIAE